MSTTKQINAAWRPVGQESAVQTGMQLPQPANSQVGRGQLCVASPATGYASLADGAVPDQVGVGVGYPGAVTHSDPTAGNSAVLLWQGESRGLPASTIANDGFTATDLGTPYYAADENTPGKLSNYSGSNRSMHGLVLGLFQGLPVLWSGIVAWLVARCVHAADNEVAGSVAYAVDASASTDLGTAVDPVLIPRKKIHGKITSIEIVPGANLAASGVTDKRVITVYKIDTTTGIVGPTVGTFTTATQVLTKRQATQFTLSATASDLDMLETDVLGFASLHSNAGAVVPQSILRANMKVQ